MIISLYDETIAYVSPGELIGPHIGHDGKEFIMDTSKGGWYSWCLDGCVYHTELFSTEAEALAYAHGANWREAVGYEELEDDGLGKID